MTIEELKYKLDSGNLTLKEKVLVPTPEDYKMGLMLKEYFNTPLFFEEIPEHLMFTEKDPYRNFRRKASPLRVNKSRFRTLKIAKREDSPIPSVYSERNKEDIEEYTSFLALPNEMRIEVYGYKEKEKYAKEHDIQVRKLKYWDNDDEVLALVKKKRIKLFDQKTSEILYAFYKKTIQHADANRVQLWLTKVANIKDETIIDNKFTIEWKAPEPTANVIEMIEDTTNEQLKLE